MKTNSGSAKTVYILVALFLVALLVIVLALWDTPGGKKGRPDTIKSTRPFYQPQNLPQRAASDRESASFSNARDVKGPVRGKVTIIDWCSRLVLIDDDAFDMGSLDLVGVVGIGDLVEVMYEDTRQGKLIVSIRVLSKKETTPVPVKRTRHVYQPQKLPERTPAREAALAEKPRDIKGPVQGKVTIIDWCTRTVVIDGVSYDMGALDLVGRIETGDRVQVTYEDTKQGRVIDSIY